tara:strand:+ start:192 stop:416 length:225 start_codon:yes stop_codon:yes gene_type:complete
MTHNDTNTEANAVQNPHAHDELLTVREACGILKCGLTRLYQLMNKGEIKSVKLGKSRRITRSAINEFIASLMDA